MTVKGMVIGKNERHAVILLLLLMAVISSNVLGNDLLCIDDTEFFYNNPVLHLPLKELLSIFSQPFLSNQGEASQQGMYYRPVVTLFSWAGYQLWGANPVGFHVVSLLLHFVNALILFRIGQFLFLRNSLALVAAALFLVHPVHNEAISRIMSNDILAGFFFLGALYLFLRGWVWTALFLFCIGLLTKETVAVFPFLVLLLAYQKRGLRAGGRQALPFALVLIFYLSLKSIFFGFQLGGDSVPFQAKIVTTIVALAEYVRLLLVPYPLHPFYPSRLYETFADVSVWIPIVSILVLLAFCWKKRKDADLLFLFAGLFLPLLPALAKTNALPYGWENLFIAERQLYFSSMFFALLLPALVLRCEEKKRVHLQIVMCSMVFVYLPVGMVAMRYWKNDAAIISRLIKDCPTFGPSLYHQGVALFKNGEHAAALQQFQAAIYPQSSMYVAVKKTSADGEAFLVNGVKSRNTFFIDSFMAYRHPTLGGVHFAMGLVYLARDQTDSAISKFKVALALQPDNTEALTALARLYLEKGEYEKAQKEYRRLIHSGGLHNDRSGATGGGMSPGRRNPLPATRQQ